MAPPSYDFSGIVSTADQSNAIYLPQESLNAHVFIADVSARVVLSQVYRNHGSDTLFETYYVFPVPARAAVCSFEMNTTNGDRLKGVVKELSQAKEDYEEARSKGWLSGLLEQFRQDVFVVSIGSMPPNTDVTVVLSYVVDLSEDDQIDTVRFQLSSHVRARYGAPTNSALYHETNYSGPLSITVDIEMPGEILDATSLNHNPFRDLPVSPTTACASPSRRFVRKQFDSERFDFGKDFLLTVHALGLGRPRCFAEHLSDEQNASRSVAGPTTALALTIIPQFVSKIKQRQEYIFLIDRSGSMEGSRILMAKQALELILTQLPSTDSMLNIYSFGSTFRSLWFSSQRYTDASLREVTDHIHTMDADMGGTVLLGALGHTFQSRRLDMPTSIFVLTDGQIYEPQTTIQHVREAVVRASQPGAKPLRVFALGIGSGASTELCEGLARAGNGSHMMTVEGEPLEFKAKRLVNAMQTPQVKKMSVDWGGLKHVRQAPHVIPALSPGMRLLLTAIIPGEQVPTEVALKLSLSDGQIFDYHVAVQPMSQHIPSSLADALWGTADIPPLIHTLAAHMLIQDVEGGYTQPLERQRWNTLSPESKRDIVKGYIVDLGTQYQVASSRTAFVAVAAPRPSVKPPVKPPRRDSNNNRRGSSNGSTRNGTPDNGQSKGGGASGKRSSNSKASSKSDDDGTETPRGKAKLKPPTTHGSSPASQHSSKGSVKSTHASRQGKGSISGTSSDSEEDQSESPTGGIPGAFKQSSDEEAKGSGWLFDFFAHKPSPESVPEAEVICVPNPRGGNPMIFTAPPLFGYTTITTVVKSWLNTVKSFIFPKIQPGGIRRSPQGPVSQGTHQQLIPGAVLGVARLQLFDGSFAGISRELSSLVGIPESDLRGKAPSMAYGSANGSIWATAIAVAYCRKRLYKHVALWEDITDKAQAFGSKACGGNDTFENIVQEALKLFEP